MLKALITKRVRKHGRSRTCAFGYFRRCPIDVERFAQFHRYDGGALPAITTRLFGVEPLQDVVVLTRFSRTVRADEGPQPPAGHQ